MTITIKDIAKEANVSIATVSRVINNKDESIRKDTKERIKTIIRKHNYQPNRIARSMITKKTATLGLIIPDIQNPFFPELVRGVEDFANENEYSVILCNTDGDLNRERKYLDLMKEKNVDGIIYTYAFAELSKPLKGFLEENNIPMVLLDRAEPNSKMSGVYVDNEKAGYMATKHLISLNHKKIGCITGPEHIENSKERFSGYYQALKEANIPLDKEIIFTGDYQMKGGYKAAKGLIKKEVTAIFTFNDLMAFGVYQAAAELGRKIPDDLSVIGFDNIKYNHLLVPKLTTIEQSSYKMGENAVELLLKQIKGTPEQEKETIIIEPLLMINESTSQNKL
ncbi:LacI family DNA-binding transcriptional regulator [Oceanobacillus jeddahense]|uniref:LacI family DNA-binding transcriptional regulator n=1 Tax=Oceanobacillus jeddahense TaxID=1462527 RepID=UPI000595F4F9|nr:LacI family DNA-binding transcriptional regulator [Oceanobacillus jeddahense]